MITTTNSTSRAKQFCLRSIVVLLAFALVLLGSIGIGHALPGAEDEAEAEERLAAGEGPPALTEEGEAADPDRIAPFQAMWIILFEDAEEGRTTASIQGVIDPYTPLPATVHFHFAEDYELGSLEQVDFHTGDVLGDLDYTRAPSDLEDFENLATFTFTLTEGHVFYAGLSIPLPLFDTEMEMGDSPLVSFNFVPPNDLYGLVVGFVAPSPDHVGAGGQEDVVLVGETDEGEVYGIVREDVPGGELQEYLIAFGSREARDAALAEAAAAAAAEGEGEAGPFAWFTTPMGMIITGASIVIIVAVVLIIVVTSRQKDDGGDADVDDDELDLEADADEDSEEEVVTA